mmetsp:Transcript_11959/g.16447  ORF Transcript_11959/g.16447 Transcript_11959/m.16447 type:complete len:276 (+) Transcript_11959:649-1476(+)
MDSSDWPPSLRTSTVARGRTFCWPLLLLRHSAATISSSCRTPSVSPQVAFSTNSFRIRLRASSSRSAEVLMRASRLASITCLRCCISCSVRRMSHSLSSWRTSSDWATSKALSIEMRSLNSGLLPACSSAATTCRSNPLNHSLQPHGGRDRHLDVSVEGRPPERTASRVRECVGIGSAGQQVADDGQVALTGGLGQRRVLAAVAGLQVIALVNQALHALQVTVENSLYQFQTISDDFFGSVKSRDLVHFWIHCVGRFISIIALLFHNFKYVHNLK